MVVGATIVVVAPVVIVVAAALVLVVAAVVVVASRRGGHRCRWALEPGLDPGGENLVGPMIRETTKSLSGCTDDWFSDRALTSQVSPMSSPGVCVLLRTISDPSGARTTVGRGTTISKSSSCAATVVISENTTSKAQVTSIRDVRPIRTGQTTT